MNRLDEPQLPRTGRADSAPPGCIPNGISPGYDLGTGSFGDPRITAVGVELDQKLAALLEHLNLRVPGELLTSVS